MRVAALAVTSLGLACSGPPAPLAPLTAFEAPALPSEHVGTLALSGVVYEATPAGRTPLRNAPVELSHWFGMTLARIAADDGGRFHHEVGTGPTTVPAEFLALAFNSSILVTSYREGYRQPCGTITKPRLQQQVADIYLVRESVLSEHGVPSSLPLQPLILTGTVVESTPMGPRPVHGADVWAGNFDHGWGGFASTKTDRHGRFLLCGIDTSLSPNVEVHAGFVGLGSAFKSLPINATHLDHMLIEIRRQ